jgi:hypothetical protein
VRHHPFLAGFCGLAAAFACGHAAADVSNLERGLPAQVTDAEPIQQGEKQVQLTSRFDRQRSDQDQLNLEPQLQWGFADRWQASVSTRAIGGSADHAGSGDIGLQVFRKLNDEGAVLPALAAELQLDLPSGKSTRGIDPTLRVIATRTLGSRPKTHQVHLNLAWTRNNRPEAGERHERGQAIVGYSTPIGENMAFIADLVREQQREAGGMATIAEVGIRRELARQTTLSLGAGAGRGSPSAPRWRLNAGIERGF